MKKENKQTYSAPELEILEVAVEQGFAQSGGTYPSWGEEYPL